MRSLLSTVTVAATVVGGAFAAQAATISISCGAVGLELEICQQGANAWLTMGLREGKNREVRRILAHLGVEVNRLIRLSYGPFQLLDLKPGEAEPVRRHVLADQMGARLAAELDLNAVADDMRAQRKARNAKRGGGA